MDITPRSHESGGVRLFDRLMYGIGLIGPVALIPQVYQAYTTHDVSGLSLLTWSVLTLVNGAWTVYGYIHKSGSVLVANLALMLLDLAVVGAILLYR